MKKHCQVLYYPFMEEYHQYYKGTFLKNVISAYRKDLHKRLLIQNRIKYLHSDCFGM